MLYTSGETGALEAYLLALDGGGRWQVSDDGAISARWGPGGKTIYYQESADADSAMKRVDVTFDNGVPRLGRPRVFVRHPISLVQTVSGSFDVHPVDGRLIVNASMWNTRGAAHPVLVQDWSSGVKAP